MVKIYTIGIGADRQESRGLFGRTVTNPSADLDEKTLTEIAATTGGRYFRARDPKELTAIYAQLNQLEPIEQDAETIRPTASLFHWPLGVSFLLSLVLAAARSRRGSLV